MYFFGPVISDLFIISNASMLFRLFI